MKIRLSSPGARIPALVFVTRTAGDLLLDSPTDGALTWVLSTRLFPVADSRVVMSSTARAVSEAVERRQP